MKVINFLNIHHIILIYKNFTNNSVTYYTLCMKDMVKSVELPDLAGYVSVKEAAEMIGCTPSRVYQYIASGLLPAQKIGRMRILPREAVRTFKRSPAGRLRAKAPVWRSYRSHVKLSITIIRVQIRKGQQKKLLQMLRSVEPEDHTFPGTIARYIFGDARTIEILLVWKDTEMPDETTREQHLLSFQQALADFVDWETAQVSSKDVFLHT
jgi:excisionase family DNA binding protein